MDDRSAQSTHVREFVVALALAGAVGGVAFWAWRQRAPLSRTYRRTKRRRDGRRRGRERESEREPRTDPV